MLESERGAEQGWLIEAAPDHLHADRHPVAPAHATTQSQTGIVRSANLTAHRLYACGPR